jgi:hypothetical protein
LVVVDEVVGDVVDEVVVGCVVPEMTQTPVIQFI